jgi:K+-sensing histidine kinase KdpD
MLQILATAKRKSRRSAWSLWRDLVLPSARAIGANVMPVLASLVLVVITTLIYFLIDRLKLLNFVPIVYMVPVVIAATRWGIFPAIVTSIAAFLVSDYFFYQPYYTFEIDDPRQVVDLLLFLFVALVTGNLASHLKRKADALAESKKELHDLYEFSRRLASCFTAADLVFAIQTYLTNALGCTVYLIGATDEDLESFDGRTVPQAIRQEAAAMVAAQDHNSRSIADPESGGLWLMRPLVSETAHHGVIAVDLGVGSYAVARRVDTILADADTALERLDLAKAMNEANVRRHADRLKEALIGTVSHELRTPLTSILGAATVLDQTPEIQSNSAIRSLVEAVRDEARHLDFNIQTLLNATRITARGVHPRLEWVDPADIINAAIKQRAQRLEKHHLQLDLASELPLIRVESTLIEQAFGQLLDNAAKYSPLATSIRIAARTDDDHVEMSVTDNGDGLTPDEALQLGRRAFRSRRHLGTVPGSGLGLWIAKTFVNANGGTLTSVSRGPGLGTTMSLRFPAAAETAYEPMAMVDG